MNGLPIEAVVVLVGVGVVALSWLLLRFGRTIAKWGLIFGGLAVALVFGLALFEGQRATRQTATVATVAQASAGAGVVLAWLLGILLLGALGVIGWLLLRQNRQSRTESAQGRLRGDGLRYDRLPRQRRQQGPIYFVDVEDDNGVNGVEFFAGEVFDETVW